MRAPAADPRTLLRDELVTIREPEGEGTFHWILARR